MNQEKQLEALRLADRMEWYCLGEPVDAEMREAAAELRRLHAENTAQRAELAAEAARTAEEKLRADQMTKQHRTQCDISKSAVATLVGLGYTDRGGEQWAPPIGKAPDFNLLDAANAQISELQAQLSAIGAGGVEELRKRDVSNMARHLFSLCESIDEQNDGLTEFERGMRTAARRIRKEVGALAPAQEDAQIAKLTTAYTELSNMFHDQIVAQQAAWIEWQHGQGAEAAMGWIENGLCGPGHIPDEDDPYGKEAQAWFDANKSDPFPACACGRPSNILWMDQGFCSKAHYDAARAAQG